MTPIFFDELNQTQGHLLGEQCWLHGQLASCSWPWSSCECCWWGQVDMKITKEKLQVVTLPTTIMEVENGSLQDFFRLTIGPFSTSIIMGERVGFFGLKVLENSREWNWKKGEQMKMLDTSWMNLGCMGNAKQWLQSDHGTKWHHSIRRIEPKN